MGVFSFHSSYLFDRCDGPTLNAALLRQHALGAAYGFEDCHAAGLCQYANRIFKKEILVCLRLASNYTTYTYNPHLQTRSILQDYACFATTGLLDIPSCHPIFVLTSNQPFVRNLGLYKSSGGRGMVMTRYLAACTK